MEFPGFGRMAEPLARDGLLRYRVAAAVVVAFGFALSVAAFFAIGGREREVVRLTFEQKAQNDVAAINLAMERGLESVENAGALFDSGSGITSAQFRAFGERALARNPAVKAVAWTPLVTRNGRRAHEAAAQRDEPGYRIKELNAQFRMVPAGDRDEYFPIRYSVDRDGPEQSPLGLDRLSVANSRGGIERSRASGEATSSGGIRITTGHFQGEMGVALSRPVYRGGASLYTPEQRSRNLIGFTISIVVVRDLIDNVLKRLGSEGIRVALYDESAPEAERFLAVWPDVEQKDPASAGTQALQRRATFRVGDRDWAAVMTPEPGSFGTAASWRAWAVAGAGFLFALLLAVYLESARRHAARMREQATTDLLTGLNNRRYLWDLLEREFVRARRKGTTIAVIMIDIDHFKRVNDTFGHDAGDLVLAKLGALLKRAVRASDIACRYGGEEFALVLPEISVDNVRRKAEALRQTVQRLALESRGKPLGPIRISLGVAVFPVHAGDAESLLRRADEALYGAKKGGRDRVVVAQAEPAGADASPAPA